MQVTIEEGKLFYKLYSALLGYVNRKLGIVPGQFSDSSEYTSLPPQTRGKVRDPLYEHRELIDQFVAENPAGLSPEELETVVGWKHALVGRQGRRVLTACSGKDLEHVVIVPTASAAFHGHAVFLGMLLQQGQREAIQPGEVLAQTLVTDA